MALERRFSSTSTFLDIMTSLVSGCDADSRRTIQNLGIGITNPFCVICVAAFKKAMKLMDGIDIVINNAGILDERRWEREIAVNMVCRAKCLIH